MPPSSLRLRNQSEAQSQETSKTYRTKTGHGKTKHEDGRANIESSRRTEEGVTHYYSWGRYHGGRRPSSDDSFHSPTVIPPSALDNPSIMKRYHRRRTCSHTSPRRSPTMGNASWYWVCRVLMVEWRLDCENCRHLTVAGLHDTGPWARMHHKVVGNFGSEADVRSLYYQRFRFNETSDVVACTHGRPAK